MSKKKIISAILAMVMLFNTLMPTMFVLANDDLQEEELIVENSNAVISGEYQYSASEGNNIQNRDTFIYRDDCFTRSSFLGCNHLETLSIQVASASISWYGEEEDSMELDATENAHNLVQLLNNLEFEDVETNKYYTTEKHKNSAGVAVGHKTIIANGQPYTLLAVIPRSAGYKEEWVGNFTIGDGDIHVGFKAARDEILRYVKKYIQDHQIEGDLKVWIAGYSRGAAISDMLGGFFTGGGIEYFGDSVSITPEDVYCYTIGTPKTIKDGLSKNIELSVSGNREESEYADDTPGEAFEYTKGGTVSVGDSIYNGLRNVISTLDSFALLPPSGWDFTHYGVDINPDDNLSSEKEMLEELKNISKYQYNQYTEKGKLKPFKYKTFDLKTLSIVEDGGTILPSDFITQRLESLTKKEKTNKDFADDDYEAALQSFGGVLGLSETFLFAGDLSIDGIDTATAAEAILFTFLAYASDCVIQEGKADNEMDAAMIVISDLLSFLFEEDIDVNTLTIDEFVEIITKYISENEVVGDMVVSTMENNIPDNYKDMMPGMFGSFCTNSSEEFVLKDALKAFIKACSLGPDPESEAYNYYTTPQEVRSLLYIIVYIAVGEKFPEIETLLKNDSSNITAPGLVSDFIDIMFNKIMIIKDEDGETVKEYNSFAEIADDKLNCLIADVSEGLIEQSELVYGTEYKNNLQNYFDEMQNNISGVREIFSIFLFYPGDEYSAEGVVRGLVTLISNSSQIAIEHLDEIYLAKSRTANRYESHDYCTVTFELNGGTSENIEESITIIKGKKIERPSNPYKPVYSFVAWFVDEELTTRFDFNTPIEEDMVLYAKWRKSVSSSKNNSSSESKETETKDQEVETQTKETVSWSNASEWAIEELTKANEKELIPSTFDKKDFTKTITRKDFAAVAVKMYEAITQTTIEPVKANPFTDTDDEYVLKAYAAGITQGTSETTFTPDMPITREQMATMLTRGLSKAGIDISISLEDVDRFVDDYEMHDWGREAVYFMAGKNIIKGIGDNQFNTLGNATIEQSLAIALRSVDIFEK